MKTNKQQTKILNNAELIEKIENKWIELEQTMLSDKALKKACAIYNVTSDWYFEMLLKLEKIAV